MTNQNLFKEAIADAKTVREIALQNAKVALEETLTPRLQSMLSAKLQEMEKDEDLNESPETDENLDEDFDLSSILAELDETDEIEEAKKGDEEDDKPEEDDAPETEEAPEEVLVKDMTADDLKAMIQDIVAQEMGAGVGGDEMDLGADAPMDDLGGEAPVDDLGGETTDDEIDLEELLAELDALDETEDNDADDLDEAKKKVKSDDTKKVKKELDEAVNVIKTLRNELHEQNLLNAKLLYVNKIFKAKNLTESQKLKVISSFDKATNVKEAKIVFESLNAAIQTSPKKQIKESLGFASKATGNAPSKNIIETDAVVSRWQKLANIK